jgi:hypothetical protein
MDEKYHGIAAVLACVAVLASVLVIGFGPSGVIGLSSAAPTPSQNQTVSINFTNQTTNGSGVVIQSVTLSQPGFVAIHSEGYAVGPAPAPSSIIAVSERLSAGTHHNVTIDISHAPPGNLPGLNRSQLNKSQTLAAVVYQDSNGNRQFDFVQSYGAVDTSITNNGKTVRAIARVRVPMSKPKPASVVFQNQTLRDNTLIVAHVYLPKGGFLVAHNESYLRTGDAVTSAIGVSQYLSPGNHTNVTVRLSSSALNETQIVTIRPSLDTNNNQQYDFIRSGGFQDVAYTTLNHSEIINDSALVHVPTSDRPTRTPSQIPVFNQSTTTVSSSETPTTANSSDSAGKSGGIFGSIGVEELIVMVVLLVAVIFIIWRIR